MSQNVFNETRRRCQKGSGRGRLDRRHQGAKEEDLRDGWHIVEHKSGGAQLRIRLEEILGLLRIAMSAEATIYIGTKAKTR